MRPPLRFLLSIALNFAFLDAAFAESATSFRQKLQLSNRSIDRRGSLPNSFADVVQDILPAIVSISSSRIVRRQPVDPFWDEMLRDFLGDAYKEQKKQQGLGSGVLVTSDGYVITNNHVISGADEIMVTLPNLRQQHQAQLIAADPSTDVALLKIDGESFPRATLADSDLVRVGDVVLTVGNPFEFEHTVTQGIVSALGRNHVMGGGMDYANFIQTDAPINPGNSGGALVDSSGRVIGINTMIYSNTGSSMGIGFAIPINMALRVIGSLLDEGQVQRGFLGVEMAPVNPEAARALGRNDFSGALVAHVIAGSPADQAGLRRGDLILEYEGRQVPDTARLRLLVGNTPPDTPVTFGVYRNGRLLQIPVTLAKLPGENRAFVNNPGADDSSSKSVVKARPVRMPFFLDGVEMATLDSQRRRESGLTAEFEGVLVTAVDPRSPAAHAGLQPGDLIVEVGREPVRSAQDVISAGNAAEDTRVILGIIRDGSPSFLMVSATR